MELLRTIWIINFFFFLLVLMFLWSKLYLIQRKMNEVSGLVKSCNAFKEGTEKKNQAGRQ
jgi:hypothetical protein